MLDNLYNSRAESDRLACLLCFFSRDTGEWKTSLPEPSPDLFYVARETPLSSEYPLFALAYELWFILNYLGIDREDQQSHALAQLRILLQILWDAGSIAHIDWHGYGGDDRWDDYWNLVRRLAIESLGSEPRNAPFEFNRFLSVVSPVKTPSPDLIG